VDHRECLDHVPAPVTGNPGLTDEHRLFVRNAVGRLKEKYQTVVVMRFVGGLNASEIALQLNQKPGTVRVWLHRAYAMLRESLAPLVQEVSL
jgi:RNA polymerase sigma factor (sigma-70 family)